MSNSRNHDSLPDDLIRNRIASALARLEQSESDADLDAALDAVETQPLSPVAARRILGRVRQSIVAASNVIDNQPRQRPRVSRSDEYAAATRTPSAAAKAATPMTVACLTLLLAIAVTIGWFVPVQPRSVARQAQETPGPLSTQLIPATEPVRASAVNSAISRGVVGATLTTGPREKRRVTLPDGSVLSINERSKVEIAGPRRIKLVEGEVYVEVIPAALFADGPSTGTAARFVVETPKRQITALGTKFVVKSDEDATNVTVTQGKVQVSGVEEVVEAGRELIADRATSNAVELRPARRSAYVVEWVKELMAAANSLIVPRSEHSGGTITVVNPQGQETKLSLRKFHVDVHIEDGFARTTIDQTYFNHTWQQLEGTFRFPLPADASLSRLAMYVNGTLMEGGMVERDYGRNVFEQIRHTRRDPALLEWVDGSTFQMRVFPLEARQEKRILLSYTQRLPSDYGKSTYRFPSAHSLEAVRDWSAFVRVKGGDGTRWYSPSHLMTSRNEQGDLLIEGRDEYAALDRDLVLEFGGETAAAESQPEPVWSRFDQDNIQYLMLRWRPELKTKATLRPRHWIFLVENSADRNTILAEAQRQIVKTLLENLEHSDTISVIRAGTQPDLFREQPVECTLDQAAAAIEFLKEVAPIGALDLAQALRAVREQANSDRETWVVHLGTGIPVLGERDQTTLLRQLPAKARYVGVAVGKRWSKAFMESAAKQTGGHVSQINPDEALAWRAFELLSTLNAPRLTEISVTSVADAQLETAKADAPQLLLLTNWLSQGQELAAVARLPVGRDWPRSIEVVGKLNGDAYSQTVAVPDGLSTKPVVAPGVTTDRATVVVTSTASKAGHLPRTWARLEIDRLVALGAADHKQQIVELSKSMYVMSPFTSLLVLETEAMYEQFHVDRGRKDHWALYQAPAQIPVNAEPAASQLSLLDAAKERLKAAEARVKAADSNYERAVLEKRPATDLARLERRKQAEAADIKLLTNEIHRIEQAKEAAADPVRQAWESVVHRRTFRQFRTAPQYTMYWRRLHGNRPELWNDGDFNGSGPQTWLWGKDINRNFIPAEGVPLKGLPSAYFLDDDVQYFPQWAKPGLATQLQSLQRYKMLQQLAGHRGDPSRWEFNQAISNLERRFDYLNDRIDNLEELSFDSNGSSLSTKWTLSDGEMFMVTPRIILQEEEEFLGYTGLSYDITGNGIDNNLMNFHHSRGWAARDTNWNAFSPQPVDQLFDFGLRQQITNGWPADVSFLIASNGNLDGTLVDFGTLPRLHTFSIDPVGGLAYGPVDALRVFSGPAAIEMSSGRDVWNSLSKRRRQWAGIDLRRDHPKAQQIRQVLNAKVDVNFADVPLADAIHFLEEEHKLEIWIDSKTLSEAGLNLQSEIRLVKTGTTLANVLRRLLEPFALGYVVEDDVLKITTQAVIDKTAKAARPYAEIVDFATAVSATRLREGSATYDAAASLLAAGTLMDLPGHAPGLQSWAADRLAIAEQAMAKRPAPGTVDPEARRLIEKSRLLGWERIRLVSAGKDQEQRPAVLVADGGGRFRIDRDVSEGLRETVINDGATLCHLYPEIGLGAKRTVSRFHRAAIQSVIPWFIPPVEDLSLSANLDSVGQRTVRVTPIGNSDSVTGHTVDLIFAEEGRLTELRVSDGASHELLLKQTISADGTVQLLDAKDHVLAAAEYERQRADAPDLNPATSGLVILPLPYRSLATVGVTVSFNVQNNEPDFDKLSDDEAVALLSAYFAAGNPSEAGNLIEKRFTARGDRRIGLAVLLSAIAPQHPWLANLSARYPDSSLAKLLEQFWTLHSNNQFRDDLAVTDDAAAFLKRISGVCLHFDRWSTLQLTNHPRSDAETEQNVKESLNYVQGCQSSTLALQLLLTIDNGLKQTKRLNASMAGLLSATAAAYANDRDRPDFARRSRIEWLLTVGDGPALATAKDLFRQSLFEAIDEGTVPVLHADVRTGFCKLTKTPQGQSCGLWADLVREAAQKLAGGDQPLTLIAMARRCVTLEEPALAKELVLSAITNQDLVDKRLLNLATLVYAKEATDWKLAEACAHRALDDAQLKRDPSLWRDAATVARQQQKFRDGIEFLEKAYELEYATLPKTVNLDTFRQDYDALDTLLEQRAEQLLEASPDEKAAFSRVIQRAATRWREIDPDDTNACHRAARMLAKLGQATAAWNYWTTPLAEAPDQSTNWTNFAAVMNAEQRFNVADKAWGTAFECEPTNPDILLQHAQFLRSTRQETRAREMLSTIVNRSWQPRFDSVKQRAQELLMGHVPSKAN